MSSVGLPKAWRGLNAGSCAPLPFLVCPQPRLLKTVTCVCAGFIRPAAIRPRRPPSVQSPFAQLGCYLRWGDVIRLLRGHYSSVFARTGSSAAPVGLSPPSAFGLVWRVLAGCNQSLLPTAASRRYLLRIVPWMLDPIPRRCSVCLHLFLPRRHRLSPDRELGQLPASVRELRFLAV